MAQVAVVSYRLGGPDGVSVEAAKWVRALRALGHRVTTVAGGGQADVLIPGLGLADQDPPAPGAIAAALAGCDVAVVENVCSLPLNPAAGLAVAKACRGRPAVLHHHDLPWQRPHLAHLPPPPDDPAWCHVTINDVSRKELAARGITAVTVRNTFATAGPDPTQALAARGRARAALGVHDEGLLVLQPTRALYRKNVPGGVGLAERLGATYWLLGPAEDGFDRPLAHILAGARCPVRTGAMGTGADLDPGIAYAACDLVTLPSTWEGFGNPAVESAVHRRPLVIGPYPVGAELERYGFWWFHLRDPGAVQDWLAGRPERGPGEALLRHNLAVAREHFTEDQLPRRLAAVLRRVLQ